MNFETTLSRRSFVKTASLADAAVVLGRGKVPWFPLHASENPALAPPAPSWVDKPMRWAQLTLVEDDPGKFNLRFWLDYFRRTCSDAVCLSAGGCVAHYPTQVPFHHRYRVDAVFINRWDGSGMCFCEHCRRNFREASGQELPRSGGPQDPARRAYVLWRQQRLFDLWRLWDGEVRKINPDSCVIPNTGGGATSSLDMKRIGELANPMMMKGPVRELIPVGEQKVTLRLPEGARVKKVRLLAADKHPHAERNGQRLRVTVLTILDHEIIAIDF
jgi:hypothetical protein